MNHGTYGAYSEGCRCIDCCNAQREYRREWKKRNREKMERDFDSFEHGKASTYGIGCRCDACKAARNEYMREYRIRSICGKDKPKKIYSKNDETKYTETPEERKRSNEAWRRRFEVEWGLA